MNSENSEWFVTLFSDVHISKVNNPGYPNVPKPDPGTKDEDEDKYLSIRINVNPWTWYTQTEEL